MFERARIGKPNGDGDSDSKAYAKHCYRRAQLFASQRPQNELPEESQVRDHAGSSIKPSRMRNVRLAYRAASTEWVARMMVRPNS